MLNYVSDLIPILPAAAIITAALYFGIFFLLRSRRKRPPVGRIFCEFLLTGWFVLFFYITQIKSFGNGGSALFQLTPLQPFYIALRYGIGNAAPVWQFLLHCLMFVPLGFLLPLVFPKKCRTYPRIFLVAFLLSLVTELSQLIAVRGTDVDDLIANTLGGLWGFALFLLLGAIGRALGKVDQKTHHLSRKVGFSVFLLIVTVLPFIAVNFTNHLSRYGHVYYDHLQPTVIAGVDALSDDQTTGKVYRYNDAISTDDLQDQLREQSGFSGGYLNVDGTQVLSSGDDKRIFIYPYNTWSIEWFYGQTPSADPALLPDENAAQTYAQSYFDQFAITDVTFDSFEQDEDGLLHLLYLPVQSGGADHIVYGEVRLTLGENGVLIALSDSRKYFDFYKNVKCISQKDAVQAAQDVGAGTVAGTATIQSVSSGYVFIDSTGYLVPTWNIKADFRPNGGGQSSWEPIVDAVDSLF